MSSWPRKMNAGRKVKGEAQMILFFTITSSTTESRWITRRECSTSLLRDEEEFLGGGNVGRAIRLMVGAGVTAPTASCYTSLSFSLL